MAPERQYSILKQGVEVWNKWRGENKHVKIHMNVADLFEAHLSGVDLSGADFVKVDLKNADLSKANLTNARFVDTDLSGAFLDEAILDVAGLDGTLFVKAHLWRAICKGTQLNEANFSNADMRETDLRSASLNNADLTGSDLRGADLRGASLVNARLTRANLMDVDLSRASLLGADFSEANLTGAYFSQNFLQGGNFKQSHFGGTKISNLDLGSALGLDEVNHILPSTLGTDALRLSQGKIPDVFMKGCGLSDWEIEQAKLYNPALRNEEIVHAHYKAYELRGTQALQISPLFISYSHADSPFVNKMDQYLTAKGVRFWRDIHDMKAGRIEKQIDQAMRLNPTVLLVLSEHSLKSDWVEHEIRTARGLEKERGHDVLCPISLDDTWKHSPWPQRIMEQIMEYNILDFSAWQDDSKFDGTFRKLIDGLELFYKK